jgi:hypothetical protein
MALDMQIGNLDDQGNVRDTEAGCLATTMSAGTSVCRKPQLRSWGGRANSAAGGWRVYSLAPTAPVDHTGLSAGLEAAMS